ncbi:unnamed protein product [Rotaria sordida]|uniref:Uncharacterized protein n=1 Tax=Rotaria sordida TaxID=392033 RepID=A0A819TL62_9BILA|nr:unnamed protein product [Rotaria sordida]
MLTSSNLFDLIIIGCGPAGIGAALELQNHRPTTRFVILEARDRVEGRAFTDTQTFGENNPVDIGVVVYKLNERLKQQTLTLNKYLE